MITRSFMRSEFGAGYYTIINNREFIRWKPLSIEDFFYYEAQSKSPDIVPAVLEDEIFKKCVTDQNYIKILDQLPFGTVGTVVQNIMEHSGPLSVQHFNDTLDSKRIIAQEPINHLVTLIVRAFPSYKLEDVYAMPFDTFMLRLAQAEQLLMMLNIITEPLSLIDENAEPKKKKARQIPAELRAIWEKQQENLNKPKEAPVKKEPSGKGVEFDKIDMSPEKSPIFNKNTKHPQYRPLGDLNQERITTEQTVGSEEESAERAKMVKEAQQIHAGKFGKLEFYNKK